MIYARLNSYPLLDAMNKATQAMFLAGIAQKKLAHRIRAIEANISKIEKQNHVTAKLINKIKTALSRGL